MAGARQTVEGPQVARPDRKARCAITFHFDSGNVLESIATTSPDKGGDDAITTAAGADIAFGGFGADQIDGGDGNNILLGDNGRIAYTSGVLALITTSARMMFITGPMMRTWKRCHLPFERYSSGAPVRASSGFSPAILT